METWFWYNAVPLFCSLSAAFSLSFIKTFPKNRPREHEGPEGVPAASIPEENQTVCPHISLIITAFADVFFKEQDLVNFGEFFILSHSQHCNDSPEAPADAKRPSERSEISEDGSCTIPTVCSSTAPKKHLMIPQPEKEKPLDWEMRVTAEETPINSDPRCTQQHDDQVKTSCIY